MLDWDDVVLPIGSAIGTYATASSFVGVGHQAALTLAAAALGFGVVAVLALNTLIHMWKVIVSAQSK